ncbi:MAG TPA: PQQ-binding-like beta-propeller repeat protein [Candidatus Binatia bacterium]|nr:PQQ-binding-like beta-propeller repeat protein [Candidatus Binatia bacterium]
MSAGGAVLACLVALAAAAPAVARDWPTYGGSAARLFFAPGRPRLTPANVGALRVKWTFPTGGPVTAEPAVATLRLPGEGRVQLAFVQAWDHVLYALRTRDGTALWRFPMPDQPGAPFPNAGSADVRRVDGRPTVLVAGGETMYAVDAATGEERWHFAAGTGCATPPGLCAFDGERNEVESSPIVVGGLVLFGMDVNEENGKGGFFAVDVHDGHLVWYFDIETGATCRPGRDDRVFRFDGYHTEAELGLPAGFLASRPGCGVARTRDGCGSSWSSAAVDAGRGLVYFTTASCDGGDNRGPFEEAIVALRTNGTPAWRWRPRAVDTRDLDFGAAPNLFSITAAGRGRDVVGAGAKDGTYYVLDRDGVNGVTGVRWDDADPSGLPYWRTQVVPGGSAGGIIGSAAVDPDARRVYLSTAPGDDDDLFHPQRPTVHALDADTGAVVWQNTGEPDADASFAPTLAIPGLVFAGQNLGGAVRVYDAATGVRLAAVPVGVTLAAAPAVTGGLLVVGAGSGARGPDPTAVADVQARAPARVTALCASGTPGCDPSPRDHCDRGGSAPADARALAEVPAAIARACPCRPGRVACLRTAVGAAIRDGRLRAACRRRALGDALAAACAEDAAG